MNNPLLSITYGEPLMFWADLSAAHLIEGTFNTASAATPATNFTSGDLYLPSAKLGQGNYFWAASTISNVQSTGINDFQISAFISATNPLAAGITVQQAYSIDKKIDDGVPLSGSVKTLYYNIAINGYQMVGAAGGGLSGPTGTAATSGSTATCYDNGGVPGATQQYSLEISGGSNVNCALTFVFQ